MSANLLNSPTFKIEDRRILAERILNALLADPSCRCDFKGQWKQPTADEESNWISRQFFVQLKQSFPVTAESDSPLPVDAPLESLGTQE